MPKVAIILLNWNGEKDTRECLQSLSKINYPNYEIICVDNGSTDGSPQRIKEAFPNITLIRNNENLGFAEGNNVGIKQALNQGTAYVLLLNNDTLVKADFLSELVKNTETDPTIGIATPKIYYQDKPNVIWAAGSFFNRLTGRVDGRGLNQADKGQFNKIEELDCVSGCAMLVRSAVFKKIGLLDSAYFALFEDCDFCFRAKKAGYKIVYIPTSVIYHKVSQTGGGKMSSFYMYYQIRNWLLFIKKQRIVAPFFIPYFCFILMRRLLFFLLKGDKNGFLSNLRGVWDFLVGRYGKGTQFPIK